MKRLLALLALACLLIAPLDARYVTIPEQGDMEASLHSDGNGAYALAVNAGTLAEAEYWFGVADASWDSELVTLQIYTEEMASMLDWCVNYSYDQALHAGSFLEQTYWVGRAAGYASARDFCAGY